MTKDIPTAEAMEGLGASLAKVLSAGGVVYLDGPLGAGKTTLVRGLLGALGHKGSVRSPTYALVESYECIPLVHHFDFYRLSDPQELEIMGVRDYFLPEHLCLIEWPQRGAGVLPAADLLVDIAYQGAGRVVQLSTSSETMKQRLAAYIT